MSGGWRTVLLHNGSAVCEPWRAGRAPLAEARGGGGCERRKRCTFLAFLSNAEKRLPDWREVVKKEEGGGFMLLTSGGI